MPFVEKGAWEAKMLKERKQGEHLLFVVSEDGSVMKYENQLAQTHWLSGVILPRLMSSVNS